MDRASGPLGLVMRPRMASQSHIRARARESMAGKTTIVAVALDMAKNMVATMTTPTRIRRRNIRVTKTTVVLEKTGMIQTMMTGSMASTGIEVMIGAMTRRATPSPPMVSLPLVTHQATARTILTVSSI